MPRIAPQPGDYSITKQRFSAFFGTDFDIVLRGLGAKNIYVTGTQYPQLHTLYSSGFYESGLQYSGRHGLLLCRI